MVLSSNTRSDWLTWEAPRTVIERAVPAFGSYGANPITI